MNNMEEKSSKENVASLLAFLAGRGFPAEIADERENELFLVRNIQLLLGNQQQKSQEDTFELLKGNWRLVFTTRDQLCTLSRILGGPLAVYYENIQEGSLHSCTPFKGHLLLLESPIIIIFSLILSSSLSLTFLSSFAVTIFIFQIAAKYIPNGILASRRTCMSVDSGMVFCSHLDRDVLGFSSEQFGFDKYALDSMTGFASKFDLSTGARDPLQVSFLFGWRLILRPLCLHFKTIESERREQIVYIDETTRIMMGGDYSAKHGKASNAVSIFVRA